MTYHETIYMFMSYIMVLHTVAFAFIVHKQHNTHFRPCNVHAVHVCLERSLRLSKALLSAIHIVSVLLSSARMSSSRG